MAIAPVLPAQETDKGFANYAYAIFVGTGKYDVGDRTIYVIRAPMYWNLVEPDFESRRTGYRLLLPASIGITDFDDFSDLPELDIDTLQTLVFTPGLELQIPLEANWLLKPFAQAGMGWDLKSSSQSFIWGAGGRTRAWFDDDQRWLVGGELLFSGNKPNSGDDNDSRFSRISVGAEYKWQTNQAIFGRRLAWHARLIQYIYADKADFPPPPDTEQLGRSTEVGISASIDPPITVFGFDYSQWGVSYEKSDLGAAIKLITTFPF
jgi:hypothetical protein